MTAITKEEVNIWESYDNGVRTARGFGDRQQSTQIVQLPKDDCARLEMESKLSQDDEEKGTDASAKGPKPNEILVDSIESSTSANMNLELCKKAQSIFSVYFANDKGQEERHKDYLGAGLWAKEHSCPFFSYISSINATMAWLPVFWSSEKITLPSFVVGLFRFVELCLRGIGQVFFLNNPVSGLVILIGMLVQSSRIAVHGVLALVCGNLTAMLLGLDKGLMESGLFGYNSFLVGLALATFHSSEKTSGYYTPIILGTVVVAAISTVMFMVLGKLLAPYKSPAFTLPFNVATLMFLMAVSIMQNVNMGSVREPALPNYNEVLSTGGSSATMMDAKDFFAGVLRGLGQVYLADNLWSGGLVLLAIVVCSRVAAFAAVLGSALGGGIALLTGVQGDMVSMGLYGYNTSLTAVAMFVFYAPSFGNMAITIFADIITVLAQQALDAVLLPYGLPCMTLPFTFVIIQFMMLEGATSRLIAIPPASITVPEHHLKRIHQLKSGFGYFLDAIGTESGRPVEAPCSLSTCRRKFGLSREECSLRRAIRLNDAGEIGNTKDTGCSTRSCITRLVSGFAREPLDLEWANKVFEDLIASSVNVQEEENQVKRRSVDLKSFQEFLESIGMQSKTDLDFASKSFQLMDMDRSGDLDREEFVAFAVASRALGHIKHNVKEFLDFVDANRNETLDLDELSAASTYLGFSPLTIDERKSLTQIWADDKFDMLDVINFVVFSKLKEFVDACNCITEEANTRDSSQGTTDNMSLEDPGV